MKSLYIKETKGVFYTPEVSLNADTGRCKISGESLAEDAINFYFPIIEWVKNYSKNQKKAMIWDFHLIYFDTSSSKSILYMLKILKNYMHTGGEVIINWHYPSDNDDLLDEGYQFMEDSGIDMKFVPYVLDE